MIDFDTPIRDLAGKVVLVDNEPMTFGTCSLAALQQLYPNEDATPELKVARFKLAVKIAGAKEPFKLTTDEAVVLKAVVGKFWNPLVVGRIFEAVDPASMAT